MSRKCHFRVFFHASFLPCLQKSTIIVGFQVGIEDLADNEKLTVYASGNYSVSGFYVILERKAFNLVLQFIMPSAMFVVVSWISFFMPLNGGERAGLLVTLFLVLVTMFLQVVTTAPKGKLAFKYKSKSPSFDMCC